MVSKVVAVLRSEKVARAFGINVNAGKGGECVSESIHETCHVEEHVPLVCAMRSRKAREIINFIIWIMKFKVL